MSHVVTIKSQVKDEDCARQAAAEVGAQVIGNGEHKLFREQRAVGFAIKLDGWKFPAVFDLATGAAHFDNYNGSWGAPAKLSAFQQAYGIAVAKKAARLSGRSLISSTPQADGSVRLVFAG